jgi:hypothetical protein
MDNWQRATLKVRSIVWFKEAEPDPAKMAARCGARQASSSRSRYTAAQRYDNVTIHARSRRPRRKQQGKGNGMG